MSTPHRYGITPADPGGQLFEVRLTVAEPDPAGQVFRIPAWVPGSYLIRDFARNVVGIRAESEDEPVELTKLDKSSWQCEPREAPITLVLDIYANDLSVRGAHLDTRHGYFDGTNVFPEVVGQADRPCELDIRPPPAPHGRGWRVATSMERDGAEAYGFGRYRAADYAELIDHPVEMGDLLIGEFEVRGIPHAIAVRGQPRVDMQRICRDLATVCEQHMALLGPPQDLDRYLFLLLVLAEGYGGLEHRWSSSCVCSRADLPRRGESGVSDGYRKFLGLCSHEYFHLWNVTRMKPERFVPPDLAAERHTGLLWVFEGITSYYDDLALVRSGLITPESYLELLGRTITRVLRGQGRHRQSVEESSFDAWTKFYKQDAASPNFIVSYYAKGSLVALALDLTLRHLTNNECRLDDVMRECWRRYREDGMPERGLESVARELSGAELGDFFERYVRGTADLPLERLLGEAGVRLHTRPATDAQDAGGKPASSDAEPAPWLGASIVSRDGRSVVTTVRADGPAREAGLLSGDEPVAIDDLRLTAETLDTRLKEYHPGDKVKLTVFRRDELVRLAVKLAEPPEDTCWLDVDKDAGADAEALRRAWLDA